MAAHKSARLLDTTRASCVADDPESEPGTEPKTHLTRAEFDSLLTEHGYADAASRADVTRAFRDAGVVVVGRSVAVEGVSRRIRWCGCRRGAQASAPVLLFRPFDDVGSRLGGRRRLCAKSKVRGQQCASVESQLATRAQ